MGPPAPVPSEWATLSAERTLLVVVRTTTTLSRLLDVVSLTARDRRVQTVFTHDPANRARLGAGVERALHELDATVLPWPAATRTRFDLALAASENDRLADLRAPVLLVPHGAGYQKRYPGSDVVSGLNPRRLMADGRVVPAAIALSLPEHHAWLRAACPPAAPRGCVVGDPALARMLHSAHRDSWYRAGFGARDRILVVLASTWGPDSLLGRWPDLPDELVAGLPADEYQVVVLAHPGVWAAHGPWQVRAWLSRATERGLLVVPPLAGWQAALLAASVVVSDHGSLALYAAALDKPLLMAVDGGPTTVPGSAVARLAEATARLDPGRDLRGQIDAALAGHRPGAHDAVVRPARQTAVECAPRLRALLYRLLRLAEPADTPDFPPVRPEGTRPPGGVPAFVVGGRADPEGVSLERYPDLGRGAPHDGLHHRHVVADLRLASVNQLANAQIVLTAAGPAPDAWVRDADAELARWSHAALVAAPLDGPACLLRIRPGRPGAPVPPGTGGTVLLRAAEPIDAALLASVAYVRLSSAGRLPSTDRLRIGTRIVPVEVTPAARATG